MSVDPKEVEELIGRTANYRDEAVRFGQTSHTHLEHIVSDFQDLTEQRDSALAQLKDAKDGFTPAQQEFYEAFLFDAEISNHLEKEAGGAEVAKHLKNVVAAEMTISEIAVAAENTYNDRLLGIHDLHRTNHGIDLDLGPQILPS